MRHDEMGGPAFPESTAPDGTYGGATLWDWFAAHAPVLPVGYPINEQQAQTTVWAAADAADYADAMLAERRRRMEGGSDAA